jgi:hypothetical protein
MKNKHQLWLLESLSWLFLELCWRGTLEPSEALSWLVLLLVVSLIILVLLLVPLLVLLVLLVYQVQYLY